MARTGTRFIFRRAHAAREFLCPTVALRSANALASNTTDGTFGKAATAFGYFNAGVGASALAQNTSGPNNTAFGDVALDSNINGTQNTAIGHQAAIL